MVNINKEMLHIFVCILIWYSICFIVPYVGYQMKTFETWKDKRIKAINKVLQKYNTEASDDCYYYDEYQRVLLSSARNKREYKYVDKDRS